MSVQRLFELSIDMLCVVGASGHLTLVNPAFSRTLGFSPEHLKENPFLDFVHPEDKEYTSLKLQEAGACDFVNRVQCSDGSYRRLAWRSVLEGGEVFAAVRDVTDEFENQQRLQRTNTWLVSANKSLEEFVYIASHDLREPLTGIAGYAELVRKRYSDKIDERGQHFLSSIVEQAKRLESKIDDLLQLSRAGGGKPNGLFPLNAAVEEARKALSVRIRETQAVIEVASDLPSVRGNRSEIAQVFQNLLSNALKYCKPGTIPHVRIAARLTPQGWEIQVTDDGIGFDMAHADRIFGVFQRLYTSEQYPGTGIGLAIVKKIVDKHGGSVKAQSSPNMGATFTFILPLVEPPRRESR